MSLISDIQRSKMTFSPPSEIGIDACILFWFNVNKAQSHNGAVRAPALISCTRTNQGAYARLCGSLSPGACVLEALNISPQDCLEMARLSEKGCDYFPVRTKLGTAVMISRFVPSYGIGALLFPDEETKISVTRIFKRGGRLSLTQIREAMRSNDSDMLKRTEKLLDLIEKSTMLDLPIGAKSTPRSCLLSAVYSVSELIGVKILSSLPINQESLNLSPVLSSLLLYVMALTSSCVSPDAALKLRLAGKGCSPTLECKMRIPRIPVNENPFFSSNELTFLFSLSKQINILEGYSVSRFSEEEDEASELTISLILHEPDPSEVGLKAPLEYLEYFKLSASSDGGE